MYKEINIKKNLNLNMKRLILILSLTIFLILFFSPVKANNITFDMTNPIVVKAVQLNSLDIGYNDIDSSFHVGHRSSSIYTIDSFQPDFTELSSSSISCAVGKLCKYGDIAVYDDRLFFAGVSAISGSFYYGRTGYFNMTSRTFTTLNDITASSGYIPISDKINVDENRNMLWNTELVYAQNQDFGTNFNGEGVLSSKGLPTTYQIPDYYKTAYCSNIGFTFMLEKKSGHLKGIFLDENLDFLNAYALNMEEPYYPYSNLLNTICDENENTIYIVFTNSSLTTFIIKAYYYEQHLTKYGSQIVLTEMFADVVNMTQAHSDIDGSTRFILYPALSIDGNGFVHLFYQYYGSTGYVLEVLREPEYCNCNDWINDVCVKQLMKQSRTCIPELCTDSYRFVQSDYCELEYNRSLGIYQQYTKVISDSQSCETGMKNPHDYPEIRCDVSLNIPINCENILTNATMSLDINKASNIFYNLLGVNFSSHLCNPLYNCADFTEDCETGFNRTYYWNYPNYNAGETAQAGFLVKGGNCEQRGIYPIGYYGWSEYGLKGTLSYTCNSCME